jgi:hypothetical protein
MRLYFTVFLLFIAGLNVSNACNVTISASSTAICVGKSDTLTASGASTYTWLPGGTTGNNLIVSPTVTTTFTTDQILVCVFVHFGVLAMTLGAGLF